MALGSGNDPQLVFAAHKALDDMKYEIAAELGLPVHQGSEDYWGTVATRDAGAVGGKMVQRMIRFAEQELAKQSITLK